MPCLQNITTRFDRGSFVHISIFSFHIIFTYFRRMNFISFLSLTSDQTPRPSTFLVAIFRFFFFFAEYVFAISFMKHPSTYCFWDYETCACWTQPFDCQLCKRFDRKKKTAKQEKEKNATFLLLDNTSYTWNISDEWYSCIYGTCILCERFSSSLFRFFISISASSSLSLVVVSSFFSLL